MRIRVFASWRNVDPRALAGHEVVLVDVLRATTTIAAAVARGARVVPAGSLADAKRLAKKAGKGALLAGERDGRTIRGFALGNSPAQIGGLGTLSGRVLVLTTTNGTQAMPAAKRAARVHASAMVNASATARELAGAAEVSFVCAGRSNGAPALEDLVGAGAVIAALGEARLMDAARIARDLFLAAKADLHGALRESDGGKHLLELGAADDVRACAALDSLEVAPVLVRGAFVGGVAPVARRQRTAPSRS